MFQGQNIQVFVRCRPLNTHEKRSVVEVAPEKREIKVLDRNVTSSYETKNFYFDQVFAPDAHQYDVYKTVVRPLIDQVLLGFNCTVFAYGQTGTGKTYTMEGDRSDQDLSWEEDPHCGIIPRAISQLFNALKDHDNEFTVRVSFLELYNEDTYDLLSPIDDTAKLKIFDDTHRKGSVIVGGLEEIIVQSKAEIYDILKRGSAKRQTAATLLNACSSRSHTIFSVTVHIREGSIEGEELLKIGKLNLVDLAGSENIGRSGAQDKRAREAGNINQSLLTLGRVITALVEKRPHIPYRESKLTRLLQDSLGGKTKTSIIATVSPAMIDIEDTLSTLDYASRAKKITNKPEMNQRLTKKALLREYTQEIERLRRDLQATREKNGVYIEEENYKDMCKQLSAGNTAIQEKEDRVAALQGELDRNRKLFDDFTSQYEQTKAELDKAKEHCERQKMLISAQRETEEKLASHAEELIQVAETATKDNYLLHGKKERIESILRENRASIDKYHPKVVDDMVKLESLVGLYAKDLVGIISSFHDKTSRDIESNSEILLQVSKDCKLIAKTIEAQSIRFISLDEDLKSIEKCNRQSDQFDILANECRVQSNNLQMQIENLVKLASDFQRQGQSLRSDKGFLSFSDREMLEINSRIQTDNGQMSQNLSRTSHQNGNSVSSEEIRIENFSNDNKLLADKLESQSSYLSELRKDFESQSEHFLKQANHYELLAGDWRTKSKNLMAKISDSFIKFARDSQNQAETLNNGGSMIKNLNEKMLEFRVGAQDNARQLDNATLTLNSTMRREFGSLRQDFDKFFTRDIKEDTKTGLTPQKKNYDIPKRLIRTSVCDKILEGVENSQPGPSEVM